MADYRPIPDDRMDEFRSFTSYAFSPETGPYDPDEGGELPPPAQLGEPRGLFEDGELLSACKHYFFDLRVGEAFVPAAGLAAVATPPEHRRRGLVRELLRESLREYRDDGLVLSALWPFKHPFYAQFGWRTGDRRAVHECEPGALSFARDDPVGRFRRLDEDDWRRLDSVYDAHSAPYNLVQDRREEWWRKRVFHGWRTDPYVYGWECDGEIRGYLVYNVASNGDKHLRVQEYAYADREARRSLLRFLADHDSQVSKVRFTTPANEMALDLVPDPSSVRIEVEAGPMVRLVDVERALEGYAPAADGTGNAPADGAGNTPADGTETATADVTIAVADDLAAWNDDVFRVAADDGEVTVERTDATPEVTLGVGALSQLYVGYRSVDDLVRTGDLDVSPAARDALRDLFPASPCYLREQF